MLDYNIFYNNVQKSCSQEMDALLESAKFGTTQEERKASYKKVQELSMREMGIVPLVNAFILIAHSKTLNGFTPLRTGFLKSFKESWFAI